MNGLRLSVERTASGYCVWSPDLPGCIATGDTEDEARERMTAALRIHVEGLRKAGLPVPPVAEQAASSPRMA